MTDYKLLNTQLRSLISDVPHPVANYANASALLWEHLDGINWAGFYFMENGILVLGPFQGPMACTRIAKGKGVCGTAWSEGRTQVVEDVDKFPGHIACSSLSRSEIVVPVWRNNEIIGVLDIDSEHLATFDTTDQEWLERIVQLL